MLIPLIGTAWHDKDSTLVEFILKPHVITGNLEEQGCGTMEPSQTCEATCQGAPFEDLTQGGPEGANPHVIQQETSEVMDNVTPYTLQRAGVSTCVLRETPDEPGGSNTKILTRLDIFKLLRGKNKILPLSEQINIVLNSIGHDYEISRTKKEITATLPSLLSKCNVMLKKCKSNFPYFTKKHRDWLSTTFISGSLASRKDKSGDDSNCSSSPKTKQFLNLSTRQQIRSRKSLESLLENEPQAKKIKAFIKTIHIDGEQLSSKTSKDVEFVISSCLESKTAPKKICDKICTLPQPYSVEEALAIIIDKKMSVEVYNFLHMDLQQRGYPAFPPYYKVLEAKQHCYPELVQVSEREALVPLQSLLIHTLQRIVQMQDDVFQQYCKQAKLNVLECVFEGSWGFDGSSGQAYYKQTFSDGDSDDSNLFTTTFIPLRIRIKSSSTNSVILWMNSAPQSYRSCRPIRVIYEKESREIILLEKQRIENEISNLTPIEIQISSGQTVNVTCNLYLAAIDGKVLNVILDTPSQMRCPYCKLTATKFNDLDAAFSKPVNVQDFKHGISPLHAWIRVLEFLLKIGYKNEVKKWRVLQNSDEGHLINNRKKIIQGLIREKTGVLVDVVRPNSGTTNDGNAARTLLSDKYRQEFANILNIEKSLLDDFHIILIVLSSGLPIDPEKFGNFCRDVAYKYVSMLNWHPMTVTIHKILIHGADIIKNSSVPIGMLSEQASESRNKYWRYDREHHTRKSDRKKTMYDLFHRALVSSDPIISAHRMSQRQKNLKRRSLPAAALALLKVPTLENISTPASDINIDQSTYDDYDELKDQVEILVVEEDEGII